MFPKFQKHAKKLIEDDERLDQVLSLRKESSAYYEDFLKAEKRYNKTISHLEKDKETSRDKINNVINEYLNIKKAELYSEVDLYIKTKQYIHQDEWDLIIEKSTKGFDKYKEFQDKQVVKNEKYWLKLKKKFRDQNTELQEEVNSIIAAYNNYNHQEMSLRSPSNTRLLDYDTSKDELIEMVDQAIKAQQKLFDIRLDLRDLIFSNPDKFKVKKAMNKLKKVTY